MTNQQHRPLLSEDQLKEELREQQKKLETEIYNHKAQKHRYRDKCHKLDLELKNIEDKQEKI